VAKRLAPRRRRGHIQPLADGRYRVHVYAGKDAITGKDRRLTAYVATADEAERELTRLLHELDTRRAAQAKVVMSFLLDRWLETIEIEDSTRREYLGKIKRHIRPALGDVPAAKVDAELLERLYARLRRCGDPMCSRPRVHHRRPDEHDCEKARCAPCRGLSSSSIRQVHAIISGAMATGLRWGWLTSNPAAIARKPKLPAPNPKPPTPDEAARVVAGAWDEDPDFGTLVWLVTTTGIRRGEVCGLRWSRVHLDAKVLEIRRVWTGKIEKDTKTHQMRLIALDDETVQILRQHRERWLGRVHALGLDDLPGTAFVFSYQPDASVPIHPDSLTHRYGRLATKLGIDTHLHALRHYTATELLAAGFDLRTVAGRLGHGGGGATTLRVYAAWSAATDQRAAAFLGERMRPSAPDGAT
jgi:integrase